MDQFWKWYQAQVERDSSTVEEIPFSQLAKWYVDQSRGDLCHDSGKFFSIIGVRFTVEVDELTQQWEQPMVNQPEFGVLGLLSKQKDGERYFLMQARMEPGNINVIQLSPTVQATTSNFTRVHAGKKTDYLDYFIEAQASHILVDSLQAEQGGRFYQKRNRNIVVEVDEDIEVKEHYCWVPERKIGTLLWKDNLVNMNNRSVLACYLSAGVTSESIGLNSIERVISWLTQARVRTKSKRERIPLKDVSNWKMENCQIRHVTRNYFSVVAIKVTSNNREISEWTQPILKESKLGFIGSLIKKFEGVDHYLVRAKIEPGNIDTIAIGPTVQYSYENIDQDDRFMPLFSNAKLGEIRYKARLSEEGGRFYHNQNDYMAVEIDEDIEVPATHLWVSYSQMLQLIRYSLLNIEARTIVAGVNVGLHAVKHNPWPH